MKRSIVILLICTLLIGCKATQHYIPIEHTKIEYVNTVQIDTCIIRDSVYIREKNDTVYLEKYKYIYKNVLARDTIIINDSIPIIKTVEVIKEINRIKDWQIALMVLGGAFIVFLLLKIKKALRI